MLVRQALKGAAERGAEVEEIYLPAFKIEYCRGCFRCMSNGKCPIQDDFPALREKILNANGIVISSPCYGLAPTACMKAFLDRIGMYNAYTSQLGGKYVISISSAGAMGAKKVAKGLAGPIANGVFKRGFISGYLSVNAAYASTCTNPEQLKQAYLLGQKIANDIRDRKRYPFQGIGKRILNMLFLKKVFTQNVIYHKDDMMKAVYMELKEQGLIA
jgi:multimeric flavodoxin WrbA